MIDVWWWHKEGFFMFNKVYTLRSLSILKVIIAFNGANFDISYRKSYLE